MNSATYPKCCLTLLTTYRMQPFFHRCYIDERARSLHSAIKKWYFLEGDKLEAKVDDFVVDIVRGDLLIEIQTANFSAIKPKLLCLLNEHKVRLVYPIPREKWIVHKSPATGETFGRRRSPKKGRLLDLFARAFRARMNQVSL